MSASSSSGLRCRICGEHSDGSHFGVDACRACAAFFRRTVNLKKKYVCRQGTNNCNISNSIRCMCRSCRWKKCLECGMLASNVQPKRDRLKNSYESEDMKPSAQSLIVASPSDSEQLGKGMIAPVFPCPEASTSAFVPVSVLNYQSAPEQWPILRRFHEGYAQLCEARRAAEMAFSSDPLQNVFVRNNDRLKIGNFDHMTKVRRADIPLLADFLERTCSEFAVLPHDQKWALFHHFVCHMWTLEACFRTIRHFPDEREEKIMFTENTYIDLNNMENFLEASDRPINEDVMRILRNHFINHFELVNTMRSMQITDAEFAALVALLLWSEGVEGTNAETARVAREARRAIFHDMHCYFVGELGMTEYAHRFGEQLVVLGFIQRFFQQISESLELARLYDFEKPAPVEDDFFYRFVNQRD